MLPAAIIVAFYIHRRDIYDLHHSILGNPCVLISLLKLIVPKISETLKQVVSIPCVGLLFAVLTTAIITYALKVAVGRPRPDFFWRCFPDGKEVCFLILVANFIHEVVSYYISLLVICCGNVSVFVCIRYMIKWQEMLFVMERKRYWMMGTRVFQVVTLHVICYLYSLIFGNFTKKMILHKGHCSYLQKVAFEYSKHISS